MSSCFCLEVAGPFACFTRPEMKVERVSYDVMTPSAARAVFESSLWKPAIRWRVQRIEVPSPTGFPDRIELRDMRPGEHALLLNHVHQPAATPYRASHAIFVREGAMRAAEFVDDVPAVLAARLLSLRAFDAGHMMVDADVVEGSELDAAIRRMLDVRTVAYPHAHNARRGCFAARIERS